MIYNHYLAKNQDIMKSIEKSYEVKLGDILGKEGTSYEQIHKLTNFF